MTWRGQVGRERGRYQKINRSIAALLALVSPAERSRLLIGGLTLVFIMGNGEVLVRLEDWTSEHSDRALGRLPNFGLMSWEVATVAGKYAAERLGVSPESRMVADLRPLYRGRLPLLV